MSFRPPVRITGAWENLPEHGTKPPAVREAERLERELQEARERVRQLDDRYRHALKMSIREIARIWDPLGAARALHYSHFRVAEALYNLYQTDREVRDEAD